MADIWWAQLISEEIHYHVSGKENKNNIVLSSMTYGCETWVSEQKKNQHHKLALAHRSIMGEIDAGKTTLDGWRNESIRQDTNMIYIIYRSEN